MNYVGSALSGQRPAPRAEHVRCTEDWCQAVMKLDRNLLTCLQCSATRFATPDEARRARAAWEAVK